MADSAGEITELLREVQANHPGAQYRLVTLVYRELHKIACNRVGGSDRRLADPTTLVNEAYLRLFKEEDRSWENRHHFFFVAAPVRMETRSQPFIKAFKIASRGALVGAKNRVVVFVSIKLAHEVL